MLRSRIWGAYYLGRCSVRVTRLVEHVQKYVVILHSKLELLIRLCRYFLPGFVRRTILNNNTRRLSTTYFDLLKPSTRFIERKCFTPERKISWYRWNYVVNDKSSTESNKISKLRNKSNTKQFLQPWAEYGILHYASVAHGIKTTP